MLDRVKVNKCLNERSFLGWIYFFYILYNADGKKTVRAKRLRYNYLLTIEKVHKCKKVKAVIVFRYNYKLKQSASNLLFCFLILMSVCCHHNFEVS